jgi:hypothetical protein
MAHWYMHVYKFLYYGKFHLPIQDIVLAFEQEVYCHV